MGVGIGAETTVATAATGVAMGALAALVVGTRRNIPCNRRKTQCRFCCKSSPPASSVGTCYCRMLSNRIAAEAATTVGPVGAVGTVSRTYAWRGDPTASHNHNLGLPQLWHLLDTGSHHNKCMRQE